MGKALNKKGKYSHGGNKYQKLVRDGKAAPSVWSKAPKGRKKI